VASTTSPVVPSKPTVGAFVVKEAELEVKA